MRNLSEVLPTNVTELRGGRAKFHCWIRTGSSSSSRPLLVQWLKRLPKAPYRGQVNSNASLVVGDEQYQGKNVENNPSIISVMFSCVWHNPFGLVVFLAVLGGAEDLVRKEDGSYLKTLVLDPLHESHDGAYLCLGISPNGFNMERAYLNIKLSSNTAFLPFYLMEQDDVPLSLFFFILIRFQITKVGRRNQCRCPSWSHSRPPSS